VLTSLADRLGEHCQLGVRDENSVVYVDTVKAPRSQGLHFEPGRRSPIYCTSIGKLFLAEMEAGEFEWWLAHTELAPLTPNTITKPEALQKAVRAVRRNGWATSNEEVAAGVVGCAVPVRDRAGKMVAGLGISVPSARVAHNQLAQFRAALEAAAAEITAFLPEAA
jgi:IclR family transcriptional regulator, acetate operon repressor